MTLLRFSWLTGGLPHYPIKGQRRKLDGEGIELLQREKVSQFLQAALFGKQACKVVAENAPPFFCSAKS